MEWNGMEGMEWNGMETNLFYFICRIRQKLAVTDVYSEYDTQIVEKPILRPCHEHINGTVAHSDLQ